MCFRRSGVYVSLMGLTRVVNQTVLKTRCWLWKYWLLHLVRVLLALFCILVDSGSSCSFLSETLAAQLIGASQLSNAPKVHIVDGSLVPCSLGFHDLSWEV
jgi:hypothetical protein